MFIVICIMLSGMGLGFLLRKHNLDKIRYAITAFIWVLLFLLGLEVGTDDRIISGLHTLGFEAIIITLAAITGSCFAAWGLWKIVMNSNKNTDNER